VKPKEGLVHETVSGKALDRAMEIAQRPVVTYDGIARPPLTSRPQRHRTPLAQGLRLNEISS